MKAICAWRSFLPHSGTPRPAFIVFIIKMYFISSLLGFNLAPLPAPLSANLSPRLILDLLGLGIVRCELPHLNRHVRGHSSRPRRRGNPPGYGVRTFGGRHVHD